METIKHCTEEHCLTCSDAMLPVRVLSLHKETGMALVEFEGQQEEIDVSLVEQVAPGTFLLVHGGVALACLSEDPSGEAGK
jgi:hydrogenase assembly chaperone HypC/HupF